MSHDREPIDRTDWLSGEWDDEPDKEVWVDSTTGYQCDVGRAQRGYLSGTVFVEKGHPLYGQSIESVPRRDDLTDREVTVAFQHGELWGFGFDCGHIGETQPGASSMDIYGDSGYRNIAYVKRCCGTLARQLCSFLVIDD